MECIYGYKMTKVHTAEEVNTSTQAAVMSQAVHAPVRVRTRSCTKAVRNATMTGASRDNLSGNTSERELSPPPPPLRGEEGMTPLSLRGRGGTGARPVASGGGTQQPGGGSSTSAGDGGGLTRATRSSTLLVRLRDKTSQNRLSRASRRDAHLPPG